MAVWKAVGCILVVLLVFRRLEQSPLIFQEYMNDPLQTHHIARRAASLNCTEYELEIVIEISDLDALRRRLDLLTLPLMIFTTNVTAIDITTECSPTNGGHQCRCTDNYAFPTSTCANHNVCDTIVGGRCGCINSIPAGGYCELNTSSLVIPSTTTTEPMTERTTPTKAKTTVTQKPTTKHQTPTKTRTTPKKITPTVTRKPTTKHQTPTKTKTTPARIPPTEENLNFTMDVTYQDSYNDKNSEFYIEIEEIIEREFQNVVPGAQVKNLTFSPGSTIANYVVEAAFADPGVVSQATTELFRALSEVHPMIFDSPLPLGFTPSEVILGKSVTITCGPPPSSLTSDNPLTAQWRINNKEIQADAEHSFLIEGRIATLRISRVDESDNGLYECRLKFNQSVSTLTFRQSSSFQSNPSPRLRVSPINLKVGCDEGPVTRTCSVNSPYKVRFRNTNITAGQEVSSVFTVQQCANQVQRLTCEEVTYPEFTRDIVVEVVTQTFTCVDDPVFGSGFLDDKGTAPCEPNEDGEKTAICNSTGLWGNRQDTCVLKIISDLLEKSEFLDNSSLPSFLEEVRENIEELADEVNESPNNLNATVSILQNIADLALLGNISLNERSMTDFLKTTSVLTADSAKSSWKELNRKTDLSVSRSSTRQTVRPRNESTSSVFLFSIESVARVLTNESFNISTDNILLDKTTFANTFSADFNSSVEIDLQQSEGGTESLTVITFASMDNVLPARDEDNSSLTVINGNVVIVQSSGSRIDNISFTFDVRNTSLGKPQCVFWNFSLLDRLGAWDDGGCQLVSEVNGTVTCTCDHLTAFSMLMSPFTPESLFLEIMTYIGVAISIACLVICLIIEAYAWKRMKLKDLTYLRHVCIVNIAVSLLIADIWFIIGAAVSESVVKTEGTCSTVTFFIHLFYLALFFWMLLFGLLLMRSMVSVFDTGSSKRSQLAIGFSLGYGAPLLIAVITIAVTAPNKEYTVSPKVCWLNFFQSKALLAFVIPALTIVAINLGILIYVLYVMLIGRRGQLGNSAWNQQQSDIVVIFRTVAILSPFIGLTWSLGVGTMVDPRNEGIHVAFAFFNSLQGFFILVFGTLWDKKVRKELGLKSRSSMSSTRNTTSGTSSTGLLGRWRRRPRDGYNVSNSHSSGNT